MPGRTHRSKDRRHFPRIGGASRLSNASSQHSSSTGNGSPGGPKHPKVICARGIPLKEPEVRTLNACQPKLQQNTIKLPVMARYLDGSIFVAKASSLRGAGDAVNYGITASLL
jgi:hypothetical protein